MRHHSPVCAAAVPAWLDAAQPDRIFLELPPDFQAWIPWLAHAEATAPLALAASGAGVAFYPFADFSPELVVVRWAAARGVPVEAFDLPVGAAVDGARGGGAEVDLPDWDSLVEAPAMDAEPEAIRRAALVYGWALRRAQGASARDLAREAHMRARLAATPSARPVVVTGAFHCAALVADASVDPLPRTDTFPTAPRAPSTSLIPYRMDLLDDRAGYPAGIRDPGWHGRVHRCLALSEPIAPMVASVIVEVCRQMRAAKHVAGMPDAAEALRMALELARVRGLGAPGRAELLEGLQTALGQGELLGRGRVLATALERVLVGTGRGRLAPGTPRSGLEPAVEALIAALRLPGPDEREPRNIRLDPLRSDLDRRRHVTLMRLGALGVPYAEPADQVADTLTHAWRCKWEPATEASVALASAFGSDLATAAKGALLHDRPRDNGEDGVSAADELAWLTTVCACGLGDLARQGLADLSGDFLLRAGLPVMVEAVRFVDRVARGHEPGLLAEGSPPGAPGALEAFVFAPEALADLRLGLYAAAVRALDGLMGSTDPEDTKALGALVRLATAEDRAEDARLGHAVDQLAAEATPRLAGAALVARLHLGRVDGAEVGRMLGGHIFLAGSDASRHDLGERLGGALGALGPDLEASPTLLDGVAEPIETLPDADFLQRLAALRHGFDALSTAAAERLLREVAARVGQDEVGHGVVDAALAAVDHAAIAALVADGLWPEGVPVGAPPVIVAADEAPLRGPPAGSTLGVLLRWRLVLGRPDDSMPAGAARYAKALDELYGAGHGEGSRGDAGGRAPSYPTAREWGDELDALFGESIRVEVAGRAAERGDSHALLLIDPDQVTPSITLLEQALSLRGGLSEDQLVMLRRLCKRVTDELVKALAVRVRPAMTGLTSPRATRRRSDQLHLRRTVQANLRSAKRTDEGWKLVPEHLYFRNRSRRHMDWRVVMIVDTSGSMESSVIHAAMMAAILASLPAVQVSFYAFADDVIDLSDHVDDPLSLLLEVRIGGGTRIHRAVRYARERLVVPQRTLMVLLTDFEEGGSVAALLSEVRAVVESGVTALGLAALDDDKRPRFSSEVAARVVSAGMPVASLSPVELARWVAERIRGEA